VVYLTNSANNWLLPVGVFLPVAGIVVMLFIPKSEEQLHKLIALATALATAAIGVVTWPRSTTTRPARSSST